MSNDSDEILEIASVVLVVVLAITGLTFLVTKALAPSFVPGGSVTITLPRCAPLSICGDGEYCVENK